MVEVEGAKASGWRRACMSGCHKGGEVDLYRRDKERWESKLQVKMMKDGDGYVFQKSDGKIEGEL